MSQSLLVEAVPLDESKKAALFASMYANTDEGDVGGGTQVASAMALTLNAEQMDHNHLLITC